MNKRHHLSLFLVLFACFVFLLQVFCFAQDRQTNEKPLEEQARESTSWAVGYARKAKEELDKAEQAGNYEKANKLREELIVTHRQRRMQTIEDMQFLKEQGKPAVPGEFRKMAPIYEEEKEIKKLSSGTETDTAKAPRTVATELKEKTLSEKIKQSSLKERVKAKQKEQPEEKQKENIKEPARETKGQAEETARKVETGKTQNMYMPPEDEATIRMQSGMNEMPQIQKTAPMDTKTVVTEISGEAKASGEPIETKNTTLNQ